MIRLAEPKDARALARMGQQFFETTPLSKYTSFDPDSLFRLITMTPNSATFVFEVDGNAVGAVAGMVFPFTFNNSVLVCQEFFWWLDPEYRVGGVGKVLHDTLEDWAKSMGASMMFMVAIENDCTEKVCRLYNHYGYEKSEHFFMKGI